MAIMASSVATISSTICPTVVTATAMTASGRVAMAGGLQQASGTNTATQTNIRDWMQKKNVLFSVRIFSLGFLLTIASTSAGATNGLLFGESSKCNKGVVIILVFTYFSGSTPVLDPSGAYFP